MANIDIWVPFIWIVGGGDNDPDAQRPPGGAWYPDVPVSLSSAVLCHNGAPPNLLSDSPHHAVTRYVATVDEKDLPAIALHLKGKGGYQLFEGGTERDVAMVRAWQARAFEEGVAPTFFRTVAADTTERKRISKDVLLQMTGRGLPPIPAQDILAERELPSTSTTNDVDDELIDAYAKHAQRVITRPATTANGGVVNQPITYEDARAGVLSAIARVRAGQST